MFPFSCTCLSWILVCKPCQFWPNSFNQGCSTHVTLQQGEIGWSNQQMVWEILRGEVGSFSQLETEFSFQVSCTPIWNLVSLKPDRIRLWHFKQSWRSRVALQLWLLQLVPKLNRLGLRGEEDWCFSHIFGVVLDFWIRKMQWPTSHRVSVPCGPLLVPVHATSHSRSRKWRPERSSRSLPHHLCSVSLSPRCSTHHGHYSTTAATLCCPPPTWPL